LTSKGHLLKSASLIAGITVISRILGYLRDQRIAFLLGTSVAADSFVLAFSIPNLVRKMTNEGSLGASLVPVFSRYLRTGHSNDAWLLARRLFWDLALVLLLIAAVGVALSPQIIRVYTIFGWNPSHWNLAIGLNRLMFPAVIFIGLAGVAAALLNTFHVFGLPAATPILFNVTLIVFSCGVLYRPLLHWLPGSLQSPAAALAIAVVLGSALQVAIQLPSLVRRGMSLTPTVSVSDPGVQKVGRLMGPAFFGMGVYQVNLIVDRIFAASSRMPSGSVASLYVADRVMQLVLGSYAIAMSTALLPAMSHQLAAGKWDEMKHTFGFSLRIVSFITIPATLGLILLRRPIIQVLFQHGQFLADSTALTARALLCYSLGLPAFAAIKLITPMYYAAQDTWTPARVGAWALGANIVFNAIFLLFFFRSLSNGSPALASSLSAYLNFGLLFVLFRKRYGRLGARRLVPSFLKMGCCATAMAAVTYAALQFSHLSETQNFLARASLLFLVIGVSVGAYFGLAWLLRCEELGEVSLLFKRVEPEMAPIAGLEA
jgi:putative peptidoglycan lipid II flippase